LLRARIEQVLTILSGVLHWTNAAIVTDACGGREANASILTRLRLALIHIGLTIRVGVGTGAAALIPVDQVCAVALVETRLTGALVDVCLTGDARVAGQTRARPAAGCLRAYALVGRARIRLTVVDERLAVLACVARGTIARYREVRLHTGAAIETHSRHTQIDERLTVRSSVAFI
jgi:hypothetical protein